MPLPLISILLPIRNAESTLEECLQSLASQSFGNFEILALDHASTDGSRAILQAWAAQEPRLRVLSSAAPSLPEMLNQGLAQAQGSLIARMDADDVCLPQRLQAQVELLQARPEVDLCSVQVELFGQEGVSEGYRNYEAWVNSLCEPEAILRELFIECPLPHPTWLARRDLYERLGGYQDNGQPEDYGFVLRAAQAGAGLAKVPQKLLRWREHAGRHSRQHPRYGRHAFMSLRAKYLKALVLGAKPCALWGAGDRARLLARLLLQEGAKLQFCVSLDERAESVHGLPVLLPSQVPAKLDMPLIACVGSKGAREEIRAWAAGRGMEEGKDYWFAS